MRFNSPIFQKLVTQSRRYPVVMSSLLLLVLTVWAWHSVSQARAMNAAARRSEQNLQRAQRAMERLKTLVPPELTNAQVSELTHRLEQTLKQSGGSEQALTSLSFQSLGVLAGVTTTRQQAHVEFSQLNLGQIAALLDVVDPIKANCWIENLQLTPASTADKWNLVWDMQWLSHEPTAR